VRTRLRQGNSLCHGRGPANVDDHMRHDAHFSEDTQYLGHTDPSRALTAIA